MSNIYNVYLTFGTIPSLYAQMNAYIDSNPSAIFARSDGYFDKSGAENEAIVEAVNTSEAQILFVCFGAPLQETWIYANKNKLTHVRLAACLGGSLDIYAGTAKRAPAFFIKAHLEWLYRLLKEPKRIGRMMRLPKYIAGACAERLKRKKQTEKQ